MILIATFIQSLPPDQQAAIYADYMRSGPVVAARNCAHLFPGRKVDNIRKTIENTFKDKSAWGVKSAPAMEIRQQVTEEVKAIELKQLATMEEVTRDLIEKANDAYRKAMIAAEAKGTKIKDADGKVKEIRGWEPRDFLYAADCLKTVGVLLSKMNLSQNKPDDDKPGIDQAIEEMKARHARG